LKRWQMRNKGVSAVKICCGPQIGQNGLLHS
jgi:hypothetical protein